MYSALYFSPWPIRIGFSFLFLILGLWFVLSGSYNLFFLSLILISILTFLWITDLNSENNKGYINRVESRLIKYGFLLFILREVILFFSLFWCFFHSRLAAAVQRGGIWPPLGIIQIPCFGVPLVNTILLLLRGASLTWSHASRGGNKRSRTVALFITIVLGAAFLVLQGEEYATSAFRISDSVYGRIFFLATGFHGAHVFIGTVALIYAIVIKTCIDYYSNSLSFLFAAWYWHFVDVVWLFLFLCVYWWGGL